MTDRAAELDRILTDRLKRSVHVEQTLLDVANGKRPALTPDECRSLALELGTPSAAPPADPLFEALDDATEWGSALNDASWAFIDAYRQHMGEGVPAPLFNSSKSLIRVAILRYINALRERKKP